MQRYYRSLKRLTRNMEKQKFGVRWLCYRFHTPRPSLGRPPQPLRNCGIPEGAFTEMDLWILQEIVAVIALRGSCRCTTVMAVDRGRASAYESGSRATALQISSSSYFRPALKGCKRAYLPLITIKITTHTQ